MKRSKMKERRKVDDTNFDKRKYEKDTKIHVASGTKERLE